MRISRTLVSAVAGLGLAGTLVGCADGSEQAGNPASENDYADGEYAATGEYQSPNGLESIEVTLTLSDNTVTAVEVTPQPTNPNTELFQGQFAGGIAAQVVGRNIDELTVDKVAGSSLTSGGFNAALEQIKADAAA